MLDLEKEPTVPKYELKLQDGVVKSYDGLLIAYSLRVIEGEEDPAKILAAVNTIFGVEVDAVQAMIILDDFAAYTTTHLEEQLKKVQWRGFSYATSSDSRPEPSES